jgi:hypothetical protein
MTTQRNGNQRNGNMTRLPSTTSHDEGAINLVLRYLRAIERKIDRLIDNNRDLKARVPALEAGLALVLDRMETRLDRIERRLELKHGPPD